MSANDEFADKALQEAGEAWRATRSGGLRRVDPSLYVDRPRARVGIMQLLAPAASVAMVVLVVALLALTLPGPDQNPGVPTSSPSASSPRVASPSSSPPPSAPPPTVGPTATAAVSPGPGLVQLTADRISTISLDEIPAGSQVYGYAQSGPRSVFIADRDRKLYLADLSDGSLAVVARVPAGDEMYRAKISGHRIAWIEGHYARYSNRVPCSHGGDLTWRLMTIDLLKGDTREIASGTHTRLSDLCGPTPPTIATDGDLVAYAIDRADVGNGLASRVILTSMVSGGAPQREFDTELHVAELALDGTRVAFLEGLYDPDGDPFDTRGKRLMISTSDHPEAREVANGALDLSFSAGRLVWMDDGSDVANPDIMTAVVDDLTPRQISTSDGYGEAVAGEGLVTWTDSAKGEQLMLWDDSTALTWRVDATQAVGPTSARDGWITWLGVDELGATYLYGVPIADVVFPAAGE